MKLGQVSFDSDFSILSGRINKAINLRSSAFFSSILKTVLMNRLSRMMVTCSKDSEAFPTTTEMLENHLLECVSDMLGPRENIEAEVDKVLTARSRISGRDAAGSLSGRPGVKSVQSLLLKSRSRFHDKLQKRIVSSQHLLTSSRRNP